MPTHKKHPVFIRIMASNKQVLCLNPLNLSTFQIIEKAKITTKDKTLIEADTIRFYYPSGTGLSYSVGIDITQEEFDYVCSTLIEYMYLNQAEFDARSVAIAGQRMAEWNKISQENQTKLDTVPVNKA